MRNLERASSFFREVLGFSVSPVQDAPDEVAAGLTGVVGASLRLAFVDAGGHHIELIEYKAPVDRNDREARPCDTGAGHLAVSVANLDDAMTAAAQHGAVVSGRPQSDPSGARAAYIRTPDGIQLEFIQFAGA